MTDQSPRAFSASKTVESRPWAAIAVAIPAIVVAAYFLGLVITGIVALVTAAVAVPLAIRNKRSEQAGHVDVTADSVVHRRGDQVLARLDRRSPAFSTVLFSDSHGLTTQLLITDGSQHVRLVSGSWHVATLQDLAAAAAVGAPTTATWKEVKAQHSDALAWWERHTTALIAGVIVGLPVLAIVVAVLAVVLFDLG